MNKEELFKKIKESRDTIKNDILIRVYREFGFIGSLTFLGGTLVLWHFPKQSTFNDRALYLVSGLFLLVLAFLNAYFRTIARSKRDKLTINAAKNSCDRLAEDIGKGKMDRESIGVVAQKIRQIHRDTNADTSYKSIN